MGQTMAASLHITPSRATSSNGLNLDGAKWYFYQTGTTTPQSVYTTAALDTTHANPVVADAAGKFANIYFDSSLEYRGVLKTSDDATTIYDIDPINTDALSRIAQSDGASLVGFIQSGTGAVATTAQAKLREAPVTPEDFGGSTGADILEAATASKEVKLSRGATYSLSSTVNLSALNGRVIFLNGATITGASGFTGTHLLAISGDTQIIGPGTINGANVAAPSAAYASSTYAGVGIFITGTGNFGRIDGVRFTNFQSGPILHDSTTTRDGFVVRNCSFDDVQKYTGHETNGVVHLHGVDYSLMENNVLETYNFKGYYVANSAFAQIVRCHSRFWTARILVLVSVLSAFRHRARQSATSPARPPIRLFMCRGALDSPSTGWTRLHPRTASFMLKALPAIPPAVSCAAFVQNVRLLAQRQTILGCISQGREPGLSPTSR